MPADLAFITDACMLDHVNGPGHPECPARLRRTIDAVRDAAVQGDVWITPEPASEPALRRVHTAGHVARIEGLRGRTAMLDADTGLAPGSVGAARMAAGAAIAAAEAAIHEPSRPAWALVRPPGHHAEPDRAMGFCLYSNVAIAAAHAVAVLECERVLIVDWDVHHGNGTQAAFWERDDVLFVSSHRWPFYPGTGAAEEIGAGAGTGYTVNLPLPAGAGDALVIDAYRTRLPPVARAFEPDLILVSAGFDAHLRDPLGGLRMTTAGFAALTALVRDLAQELTGGRLALVLEGGYDLDALAESVVACTAALRGTGGE